MEIDRDAVPPGRLYPVCCAADFTSELLDRLIQTNQNYCDQTLTNLVFVDDTTTSHTDESKIGDKKATSPSSPFKNKSPEECHKMLWQMRKDADADIDYENFMIADARSKSDGTVLLVHAEAGNAQTVRARFEVAQGALDVWLGGKAFIEDHQALAAQTEDGVLRSLY